MQGIYAARKGGDGIKREEPLKLSAGRNCRSVKHIVTKLKETSKVMIHACVLYMNLWKRLRLLLRPFFSWTPNSIQNRLEKPIFALA